MKLYYKLALINTITRMLIAAGFFVFLSGMIRNTAIRHIDNDLRTKEHTMLRLLQKKGLDNFIEDSTYADYTIFRENYVSIEPVSSPENDTIITDLRQIDTIVLECRVLKHFFQQENKTWLMEIGESTVYVSELNQVMEQLSIYILFIIIAVTVMVDLGVTRYLLRPLQKIEAKLSATRRPEKFNYKPVRTTTTDFQYLDKTIRDMMNKIQDAFNIEKEFIANVSHELLTPISILQTRLENMLATGTLSEDAEMKIIESQNTLGRLKQIVRSLLLISQIENNQAPKEDKVNIPELLKEVAAEIEERLEDKGITLQMNPGEDFVYSPANRSLLFTMFFNLVNNAIKYNNPGGKIIISFSKNNNLYVIHIQDTGKGIAPENIKSIFYRFKKFNASGEESYGLGLPMVKTIADFHNADINVESTLGQGSTFTVSFKTGKV